MTPDAETLRAERLREALDRAIPGVDEEGYTHPHYEALQLVFAEARFALSIFDPSPETVERGKEAVIRVAGTGLGEDGYAKVWVDQHAEAIALAVLAVLVAPQEKGTT